MRREGRVRDRLPVVVENRFRYNQGFKSADAMVPGVIMLILGIIPAIVSSLTGGAKVMGYGFPAAYFHGISVGAFTKAFGFADLAGSYLALSDFIAAFFILARIFLRTQEA